jgi:hypothetical protein
MNKILPPRFLVATALMAAALTALCLSACGGSSSSRQEEDAEAGVGVGGSGTGPSSVTTGAIQSLGNTITIGNVAIDIRAARIENGFGDPLAISDLQLGMWVRVTASTLNQTTDLQVAESVVAQPELMGKITNMNRPLRNFHVLGRLVQADDMTVLGGLSSFDELNIGDSVEVFGSNTSRKILATRISRKDAATRMTFGGSVSMLTSTTFTVDSIVIDYTSARVAVDGGLRNGVDVLAEGVGVLANNTFKATRVVSTTSPPLKTSSIEVMGVVSEFSGLSSFRIGDITVDASQAQIFDGIRSDIRLGTYLRAQGSFSDGLLVATRAQMRGRFDPELLTLTRTITEFRSISDFTAGDVVIDASSAAFLSGTKEQLRSQQKLRIRGRVNVNRVVAEEVWVLF